MKRFAGVAAVALSCAYGSENMLGRQSQNEGITVVPSPGRVTVDGDLADWDLSGRIWCFADQSIRSRYSAEVAAMWDREALYVAVKWRDPTPMFNTVDPEFNPRDGWKSDAVQMRVRTADQTSWLTTWFFTPRRQPVLLLDVWKDPSNDRAGQDSQLLKAPAGGTVLGGGAELAYRQDADGKGFAQELRVPWRLLFKSVPEVRADLVFRLGLEFLWGDPTGNTWPVHRYADNLQPGQTSREFFWSACKSWGDARLVARGGLASRRYVSDERRVEGRFTFRAEVPKSAARLTLAVEDEQGRRVRNLAGDLLPEEYSVAERGDARTVEIGWDGLDDQGALVKPGRYRARGLTHGGLSAEYEMCFYNPGTPPWATSDGGGAWGADHCAPLRVARAGDWMILSWAFAEGGSGIVGIGPDGRKRWGEKRGATLLAADEKYVYGVPAGWHISKDAVIRLDKATGAYRAFTRGGKELPFEYPLGEMVGRDDLAPAALAAADGELVILLNGKAAGGASWIARVDSETAELKGALLQTARLSDLTAWRGGRLYGTDGARVCSVDPASGAQTPLETPTLGRAVALGVDNDGNVLVMDAGPDQQVKAFAPAGGLRYTCGLKGGRPVRGAFEPQAMREVSSVAADAAGHVWAVEHWDFPRRVSVWSAADGKRVRDYIGNTGYSGTGCYLHDSDPSLAYVGPIELKLDKASRSWRVSRVLWVPDPAVPGERFTLSPGEHVQPQRFTATVSGAAHEYLFAAPYRDFEGYRLFMETATGWRPVCAITTVGQVSGQVDGSGQVVEEPAGEFAGLSAFDAVIWNDANSDGRVQRSECDVIQPAKPRARGREREIPIPMGSGWGERIAPDFTFYVNGVTRVRPVRFTDEGAPVYARESLQPLGVEERGDLVPVPEENLLLCLSFKGYAGPTRLAGVDARDGRVRWEYPNPYPGVHGSHRAPMPAPGLLIGPLKIAGVADAGGQAGRVFLMRGNLGQDFFVTTDGLFVGAMFQDGRLPGDRLPAKEEQLVGMPMENFTHGSEPFNGWFGRQADGRIRMTAGFPGQAAIVLAVNGLETIRRFGAGECAVTADALAAADRENQARAARGSPAKAYTVQRFERPPKIDGRDSEWEGVPSLAIERPGYPLKGTARMAADDQRLYLFYAVEDDSPWLNEGKDPTRLFKTGDCVDLQLCTDAAQAAEPKRRLPGRSDLRVVMSQLAGRPVAVLMRPVDSAADKALAVDYTSPVAPRHFDRVEVLAGAEVRVAKGGRGYTVEASLPLAALGLKPAPGLKLRGDFGFISSDAGGTVNVARTYWADKDTNLVSDLPQEAWLTPAAWGEVTFK